MKNEKEKIVRFALPESDPEIILTHAYNIRNDFPVHFHKSFTLGIVENGRRILRMFDREYPVPGGSVFIIPPYVPHSMCSTDEAGDSYKVISIGNYHGLHETCFNDPVIENAALYKMISDFHNTAEYDYSREKCDEQLKKIAAHLLDIARSLTCPHKPDNVRINAARRFIEDHYSEDLNLEKIAGQASLSPYHFNRLFHSATGVSPYAYLILCRIMASTERIGGRGKISDLAYESGFYDQSHFNRTFRKYVGVSPRRYYVNDLPSNTEILNDREEYDN